MNKLIWIVSAAAIAAPSVGWAERALPLSTTTFARELRAEMKKRGETLPDRDDCFASAVPCKITGLPETLEVWMYPDKEGALTSARVNFHDAFGNPEAVLGAARDICTAMIAVTANSRFDRKLLDRGFTSAGRLGQWSGSAADVAVRVRLDPRGDMGSCVVSPKRPGAVSHH